MVEPPAEVQILMRRRGAVAETLTRERMKVRV